MFVQGAFTSLSRGGVDIIQACSGVLLYIVRGVCLQLLSSVEVNG